MYRLVDEVEDVYGLLLRTLQFLVGDWKLLVGEVGFTVLGCRAQGLDVNPSKLRLEVQREAYVQQVWGLFLPAWFDL